MTVPTLLIVSEQDTSTPASTDADRPWALFRGRQTWRVDLAGAGHQASTDMGLFAELAPSLPGLPQMARDYMDASTADSAGPGLRPVGRDLLATQIAVVWAFLQVTLDLDIAAGIAAGHRGSVPSRR